ncbi:MAG: hypothetical protein KF767_00500 [Bdellovibrionaceae bacterium]|nr:hypothetical protein [Pseudobdellovibrionaceae bacterium]
MKKILVSLIAIVGVNAHAQFNQELFADDRARCFAFTDAVTPQQQNIINQLMGSAVHRQYHFLWHATRGGWDQLSANEQTALRRNSPVWGNHARLCPMPGASATYNPAGEEFLLMHHMMIDQLQSTLVSQGLPCIAPWTRIPSDNDATWPVPNANPWSTQPQDPKGPTARAYIDAWQEWFMDPNFLRVHTLSEVGYALEFTIHNMLHMRWAATPRQGDDFPQNLAQVLTPNFLGTQFASPEFNYLGNSYSAHVNPVFWKLHGWVDQVVAAWLRANGFTRISFNCPVGDRYCYPWQSRWNGVSSEPRGGSGHDHHAGHQGHGSHGTPKQDKALDRAVSKIARFATFDTFRPSSEPIGGAGQGQPQTLPNEDPTVYVRANNCR